MVQGEVQQQLADWIDADVLADNILEEIEEAGEEPTLENGQRVWLDFLENELHHGLVRSI